MEAFGYYIVASEERLEIIVGVTYQWRYKNNFFGRESPQSTVSVEESVVGPNNLHAQSQAVVDKYFLNFNLNVKEVPSIQAWMEVL